MKVQDLTLTDELRDIVQIGIITDDIERTKKGMLEVFGLEPDAGGHSVYKKSVYRDGKVVDAEVVSAFYNFFNIQLEFLQPTGEDDTIWSDYLKMGQNGLHHICLLYTSDAAVSPTTIRSISWALSLKQSRVRRIRSYYDGKII